MNRQNRRRKLAKDRRAKAPEPASGKPSSPAPPRLTASLSSAVATKAASSGEPPPPKRNIIAVPLGAMRAIVPGVEWPSILVGHNAHALAIQFQFQQTQWWSPERLREHQFAQLAALVRHAGDTVPYYRAVFKNMGFDHRDTLDEAAWAALPILSRNDLQDTYSKLHSERCPPSHGRLFESASSGSTGTPIKVSKAGIQQLMWEAVSLRDHLWQRRDFSGRAAAIRNPPTQTGGAPYPDGRYSESWGKPTTPFHTGSAYMLELATPINQQVEWLGRIAPSYLLSYPSNIEALSHHCLDYGISLPSIREFRSVSEVLRPEVREICRRAFGCKVTDIYSAEEVGYIALQSPDSEELLVQSETIFAEVVDQDGRHCAVHATRQPTNDPLVANLLPNVGNLRRAIPGHRPVTRAAADMPHKVRDQFSTIGRVDNFRMEHRAVKAPSVIRDDGKRRAFGRCDNAETGRQGFNLVAMAHPDLMTLAFFPKPVEQHAAVIHLQERAAKLTALSAADFAAQLLAQRLLAVANAKDRQTRFKEALRRARTASFNDRSWPATKDNARRLQPVKRRPRRIERRNLTINPGLAHAARDQLSNLTSEINNEDGRHDPRLDGPCPEVIPQ